MAKFWDVPLSPTGGIPEDRSHFLRLHPAPQGDGQEAHGTAVIIHGGYWKNRFGLDDEYGNAGTASLAPYFLQRGFGAVELEYRRRDHPGGGWPGTNEDVVTAISLLAQLRDAATGAGGDQLDVSGMASNPALGEEGLEALKRLRPDRLVLVGHSAGGCLALWAAHELAARGAPASVAAVVACAPVADLAKGHEMRVSDEGDAVELYMKCKPDDEAGRAAYARASPSALLPVTFPVVVAFGDNDKDVPPELVAGYVDEASSSAPGLVRVAFCPDADHFDVVNAGSAAWKEHIVPALAAVLGAKAPEAAAALR
mmetsp:Transcript_8764/g.24069  ORF Transcript_8764/g.24069 Transcript_8764/m.24069 type:complete len:312 (-) Transcript_8764:52-987(-)